MRIDFEGHRILLNKETLYLTQMENNILKILYKRKGKVVKYDEISKKIYKVNVDEYLKDNIKKHISLLNKKISKYIKIKNIRNIGYIIEEDLK